jgi:hypothetical protein
VSARSTALPRRGRWLRPTTTVLAAVLLAACGSGGEATPTPSATGSGSGSGPGSAAAASGTASATPSTSSAFVILPDSVLPDLSPLVYSTPAGADAGMIVQGAKASVNAVFQGGVSRELTYQGKTVGGVELYRFGPGVATDARERFVPLMVQSFAQLTPTAGTFGTQKVQVADGARGTGVTVIGWTRGEDVVLVWAQGVPAAQQIAERYLTQTGGA